jgi:uncharacterized membrane protein
MDVGQVLAIWLHTIALVIAWGYYGVLGRIVLPGLERSLDVADVIASLDTVERRAVPLVLLSMVLFTVTGTWLLVVDPAYAGPGAYFASTWTTLMLVKHFLVIAFVLVAIAVDRLIRRAGGAITEDERRTALGRIRLGAEAATGLGAVIVLLTAAAQASGS